MSKFTSDVYSAILFAAMLCGSLIVAYAMMYRFQHVLKRFQYGLPHAIMRRIREPVLLLAPVVAVLTALPLARFTPAPDQFIYHSALLVMMGTLGWFCIRLFDAWRDTLVQ